MCWLVDMLYKIKSFKNIHKPFVRKTTYIQKKILKAPRIITFPLAQESFSRGSNDSRLHVVEPPRGRSFIWQIRVNSSIQDRRQVDRGFFMESSQLYAATLTHYSTEPLTTGSNYDQLLLLLALAGDVHPNPGPSRYPCSVCFKNVTSQGTSYLCTRCSHLVHSRCSGFRHPADYRKANGWICTACITPPRPRASSPPPCPTHTPTMSDKSSTYYSGTPMVSATNRWN